MELKAGLRGDPTARLRRLWGQHRTSGRVGPLGAREAVAGRPEGQPAPIHRAESAGWTPVPLLHSNPKVFGCACGLSGVILCDLISFSAQLHLPSKASTNTRSSQGRQHKHLLPAPRGGPLLSPPNVIQTAQQASVITDSRKLGYFGQHL